MKRGVFALITTEPTDSTFDIWVQPERLKVQQPRATPWERFEIDPAACRAARFKLEHCFIIYDEDLFKKKRGIHLGRKVYCDVLVDYDYI